MLADTMKLDNLADQTSTRTARTLVLSSSTGQKVLVSLIGAT